MALKIYKKNNYIYLIDGGNNDKLYEGKTKDVIVIKTNLDSTTFSISNIKGWNRSIELAELQDADGNAYTAASWEEFYTKYTGGIEISRVDATLQASTSPLIIIKATELKGEGLLTAAAVEDTRTLTVDDTTGAEVDQLVTVYSAANNRVTFFVIKEINGNVLTVDSLIDFAYEIGSFVQYGSSNMAVDGSVTPRIFGIRNPTAQDIVLQVDFTRMILTMVLTGGGHYDEFGNIPKLDNGLMCRFVDGEKRNIFNAKTNRDLDNLMYDFKFIPASGSAPDGLSGRFTFEKLGSVVRLKPFEDLQFIVQDKLDAPGITEFEILLQGAGVTL